jgi:hypothetical protein
MTGLLSLWCNPESLAAPHGYEVAYDGLSV